MAVAGIVAVTSRGNDGIDVHLGARTRARVDAATQFEQRLSERVGDLAHEMQTDGVPVIDPLQGHSRHVRSQDFLRECVHPVKIRYCCAIIHTVRPTLKTQKIPVRAAVYQYWRG